MSNDSRFEDFVQAVEEFDLADKDIKATAHTSAVSIRWDSVAELADEKEETTAESGANPSPVNSPAETPTS